MKVISRIVIAGLIALLIVFPAAADTVERHLPDDGTTDPAPQSGAQGRAIAGISTEPPAALSGVQEAAPRTPARAWGKRYAVGDPGTFLRSRSARGTEPAGTGTRQGAAPVLEPESGTGGGAPRAGGSFVGWAPATPPRRESVQAQTSTSLRSSHAQQTPGSYVTLTVFVERFDDATNAWTPAANADVRLLQSRIAEKQPELTGGWTVLGDFRTDAGGRIVSQALVSAIGYNGFKAWETGSSAGEPLGASMSPTVWVQTRHSTHWFDQPYQPYDEARMVLMIGWAQRVGGKILDETNAPVPNQEVEVFVWETKEVVGTATTDRYGVFQWGKDYFLTDKRPPQMGVRYAGDFDYQGLPDWRCYVETVYPDPPS